MGEIRITAPTPDDAQGIQEVFYHTWLATYPNEEHGITIDDIEDRYKDILTPERIEKRRQSIMQMGNDELFLLAKAEGKIVGVCYAVREDQRNRLRAIYVLPGYQRQGIGKKFWKEAKRFFDPAKETVVDVATYNARAIGFYEKLGFVDTGKRFTEERFRMKSGSILPEMEMVLKNKP